MELRLAVRDGEGKIIFSEKGTEEVRMYIQHEYEPGDSLVLEIGTTPAYLWIQFDDVQGESLVYAAGNIVYHIPFGEKKANISQKAFAGKSHLLCARVAKEYEIRQYRNLAKQIYDQHHMENCYPHAKANVETRGETVFAAQNAIDGITINTSHGEWPFQSWGINRQEDAKIRITFGREVIADRIILYTRADFPHDNWWTEVTFRFSDGSSLTMDTVKTAEAQEIVFEEKKITWLEMSDMKKADDPSPFPALSQLEVYGRDAI